MSHPPRSVARWQSTLSGVQGARSASPCAERQWALPGSVGRRLHNQSAAVVFNIHARRRGSDAARVPDAGRCAMLISATVIVVNGVLLSGLTLMPRDMRLGRDTYSLRGFSANNSLGEDRSYVLQVAGMVGTDFCVF